MTMQKQKGFTLIELVVVIVILGILAVTAAPKFLNIQDEAKASALQGLAGGMRGALAMTYTAAIMQDLQGESDATITIEGKSVNLAYGYPKAHSDLLNVVTGLEDWSTEVGDGAVAGAAATYGYPNFNCVVSYELATSTSAAKVTVDGEQCDGSAKS